MSVEDLENFEDIIGDDEVFEVKNIFANRISLDRESLDAPNSYKEAIKSDRSQEWINAIHNEMEGLEINYTFSIVDRPNKPIVKSKYVFKIKTNEDGKIERFKARLVAKGFSQHKGIDYDETFAPVLRSETLRYMISYAAANSYLIHNLDVETAFLNGELKEEVYLKRRFLHLNYELNSC